ncbi:hypothetical protein FHL15_007690 [Xylaria flabelliformis]|uniref:Uncharacterized protein n=1 Tax=Xylaria flabelliformis TaxID=2512241 RepID=A0A553HU31_9PEZI|nr:hypothetical protein FHL15_007690 [Xylaria flabelliformis]
MAPPQHAGLGRPNLSAMKKNDTPHPSTVRHTLERSSLGSSQVIGFRANDARDENARSRKSNRRTGQADIETNAREPLPQSESERTRKLRQNLEAAIRYLRRSGGNVPPAYLQTRQPQNPVRPPSPDFIERDIDDASFVSARLTYPAVYTERDIVYADKVPPVTPASGNAEPNTVPYTISEDFSDQHRIRTQEMKLLALKDHPISAPKPLESSGELPTPRVEEFLATLHLNPDFTIRDDQGLHVSPSEV